jgi:branched-chain amino acid transport system substrate-binding protein
MDDPLAQATQPASPPPEGIEPVIQEVVTPQVTHSNPPVRRSYMWVWYVIATLAVIGIGMLGYLMLPGIAPTPVFEHKEPVRIGGILPLSGDSASFGIPIRQTLELATREINANGGIKGRMIELFFEDGMCDGVQAAVAAESVLQRKPFAIITGCSSEYLAVAPLAQKNGVLSFSSSATNPDISTLGELVFRSVPSDAFAGDVAARYARKGLGASTTAIIAEDTDYSLGLAKIYRESFIRQGGSVVLDIVVPAGTTEFTDVVQQLEKARPSVAYLLPQSPTPGILLVKAIKERNLPIDLLTAEILLIRDAVEEQGEILEGVTGIEAVFDATNPKLQRLMASFKREYGDDPPFPLDVSGAYDFMYLLQDGLPRTDGTPYGFAKFLYGMQGWDGTQGTLSFNEYGDVDASYNISRIENRQIISVDIYQGTE